MVMPTSLAPVHQNLQGTPGSVSPQQDSAIRTRQSINWPYITARRKHSGRVLALRNTHTLSNGPPRNCWRRCGCNREYELTLRGPYYHVRQSIWTWHSLLLLISNNTMTYSTEKFCRTVGLQSNTAPADAGGGGKGRNERSQRSAEWDAPLCSCAPINNLQTESRSVGEARPVGFTESRLLGFMGITCGHSQPMGPEPVQSSLSSLWRAQRPSRSCWLEVWC